VIFFFEQTKMQQQYRYIGTPHAHKHGQSEPEPEIRTNTHTHTHRCWGFGGRWSTVGGGEKERASWESMTRGRSGMQCLCAVFFLPLTSDQLFHR